MLVILNRFISYKENMLYTLPTMTWEKQLCRLLKMFLYSYTSIFFHINWSAIVSNAKELYLREPWKAAQIKSCLIVIILKMKPSRSWNQSLLCIYVYASWPRLQKKPENFTLLNAWFLLVCLGWVSFNLRVGNFPNTTVKYIQFNFSKYMYNPLLWRNEIFYSF